jgi:hypothetical protein
MHVDDALLARLCDPATPPEDLAPVWHQIEVIFNRSAPLSHEVLMAGMAIAGNPNTAVAILDRAATHFPMQVLQNPVLTLLAIEDPLFSAFSHGNLAHLVAAAEGFSHAEVRHLLMKALDERYAMAQKNAPLVHIEIPTVDIQKLQAEMRSLIASINFNALPCQPRDSTNPSTEQTQTGNAVRLMES